MQKIALRLLLVCFALTGCNNQETSLEDKRPPIPVIVIKPVIRDIPTYIESIGTFYPSINMEIRPQVSGILSEVFVTEGQWVSKHAPLMKIDSRPYAIKVQESEAQLTLDLTELEAAEKKRNRFRQLAQKDLVAQADWEEIEAHVAKAQALIAMDKARLEAAKLELDHCFLTSPIEGRVGKVDLHPGMLVNGSSSAPLLTLFQMDPLLVEFTVTQQELAKIPADNPEIEVQAICGSSFGTACAKGVVTFLDNQFDQKTGQILVRGKIPNPNFTMRPGQIVRLKIPVAVSLNVMLIPQKAVRYNEEGAYVYIVDDEKKVVKRQVLLGEEYEDQVAVLEGLEPQELVMTDGHLRAAPDTIVDVQI